MPSTRKSDPPPQRNVPGRHASRRAETIDLPLSIDDALRFTVSGGVVMPGGEALSEDEIRQIGQGALSLPPPQRSKERSG